MRPIILLIIGAVLLLSAAWNANALIDALLAVYGSEAARRVYAVLLGLIGAGLAVAALVMISRSAYRKIEQDFPETGIGATDRETAARSNERNV